MLPYEQLDELVILKRAEALPGVLKDALFSPANSHIIEQTCKSHHVVDEDKVLTTQQLAALVVLGFLHSRDLAKELGEALELNNPPLAASITDEINAKVFAPIKSAIDAAYEPFVPEKTAPAPLGDVKKTEFPPVKIAAPPAVEKKIEPPIAPPQPPAPPKPITPPSTGVPPKPSIPTGPGVPPPVMLHKESEMEPVGKTFTFKTDLAQKPQPTQVREPLKPAELELGPKPIPPPPLRPVAPPPTPVGASISGPMPVPSAASVPKPPLKPPLPPYAKTEAYPSPPVGGLGGLPKPPAPPVQPPAPPPIPKPLEVKIPESPKPPQPPVPPTVTPAAPPLTATMPTTPPQPSAGGPAPALSVDLPKEGRPPQEVIDTEELKKVTR